MTFAENDEKQKHKKRHNRTARSRCRMCRRQRSPRTFSGPRIGNTVPYSGRLLVTPYSSQPRHIAPEALRSQWDGEHANVSDECEEQGERSTFQGMSDRIYSSRTSSLACVEKSGFVAAVGPFVYCLVIILVAWRGIFQVFFFQEPRKKDSLL